MNDPTAAIQQAMQQFQAAQAAQNSTMFWIWVFVPCANILGLVLSFFVGRWFLLHVYAIQQARFFDQLDIFLYQRGVTPHVPGAKQTHRRKKSTKDTPAATPPEDSPKEQNPANPNAPMRNPFKAAPNLDQTPLEKSWQDLLKPPEPPEDDDRYKPKQ